MQCPYCGGYHPESVAFCPQTGQSLRLSGLACWNCGQPLTPGMNFCPYCNANLKQKSFRKSRWLMIGGAFRLLLLVAIVAVSVLSSRNDSDVARTPESGLVIASPTRREPASPRATQPSAVSLPLATATPGAVPERTGPLAPTVPGEAAEPTQTVAALLTVAAATPVPNTPTPLPEIAEEPGFNNVIYAYGEEIDREIYQLNPMTGAAQRLTENSRVDEAPSYAPGGDRFVYSSYRADGWELYVFELETGSERQLTRITGQARHPEWSRQPGSEWIVFEGRTGSSGRDTNVWLVHAGSGELRQVTHGNADGRPQWSPDGSSVVFGRATNDTNGDGRISLSDYNDVYVVDVETGEEVQLTRSPVYDEFQFTWSPDGEWIAYSCVREDTNHDGYKNLDDARGIYLLNVNSGEERYLALNNLSVFSPDWSGDGKYLLFSAYMSSGRSELWVYGFESGALTSISGPGPYYHTEWVPTSAR